MISRKSSRAIILNSENKIFLFQYSFDYFIDENVVWITPGGGLEEGESFDMALRRELYEELEFQLESNFQYIYYRNPVYSLKNGEKVQCEERFFLIYSDGEQFIFNHWTDSEQKRMRKGKWWSVDEIRQSKEEFFTRDIIEILSNLAHGKTPLKPLEIA